MMISITSKTIQLGLFLLAASIATVVWNSVDQFQLEYVALGLIGAVFASATGAGGGVVFIPIFHQLGLSDSAAIASSFGIQTFGMTAGAVAWLVKFSANTEDSRANLKFIALVVSVVSLPSIIGLHGVQWAALSSPAALPVFFAWFSILLGICILATLFHLKASLQFSLSRFDLMVLILLGLVGGAITAWLSVGVGELIAFYLIARGAKPNLAIASAVIVTAVSVWSMAPITFSAESPAVMPIVLAAGPAALIGGLSARYLVDRLSIFWLKVFFGLWLILIGLTAT